jgi:hypothetical protein
MTAAKLTVLGLGERVYRVTGGKDPHRVTLEPVACDCADFAYKGFRRQPPMCKHLAAVVAFRAAEPLADFLDNLSESDTLDLVDPTHGAKTAQRACFDIDLEDRAVALTALEKWGDLRRFKPKPNGYYGLWRAACEAMNGLECETTAPSQAAECYAIAHEWVRHIGRKGRVA